MRKKIIHLSYFLNNLGNSDSDKIYRYCMNLYSSNSFSINFYMYRHLYYTLNLSDLDDSMIILDLGCADGPFLPSLNRYCKKIIGLDINLNVIYNAKDLINYDKFPLKNILLLNADGIYLPFRNNSIDIIFCLETFEHIPLSNRLIDEIYRVLKNKGKLFYSLPIEIGISLIIRQIIGRLISFPRDSYTIYELLRNGILKKPSKRINNPWTHKNFDWRIIQRRINQKFKQQKVLYSPFPFLKKINPTIIFRVNKEEF